MTTSKRTPRMERRKCRSIMSKSVLLCASQTLPPGIHSSTMESIMVAVICALLSAAAFYLSIGMGEIWWLAWLAPIPVLWLAFGDTKGWQVLVASWAAYALGSTNILVPYGGVLPLSVIILSLSVPSFFFAVSVLGARFVARNL